jgi:hypothetical protein
MAKGTRQLNSKRFSSRKLKLPEIMVNVQHGVRERTLHSYLTTISQQKRSKQKLRLCLCELQGGINENIFSTSHSDVHSQTN